MLRSVSCVRANGEAVQYTVISPRGGDWRGSRKQGDTEVEVQRGRVEKNVPARGAPSQHQLVRDLAGSAISPGRHGPDGDIVPNGM